MEDLRNSNLSSQEFSAGIGKAKASGWVGIETEGSTAIVKLANAEAARVQEHLLEKTFNNPIELDSLDPTERAEAAELLRRGVLETRHNKVVWVKLTQKGESISKEIPHSVSLSASGAISSSVQTQNYIEKLTPEILSSGAWQGRELRPIDVEAKAPHFYPGRRHPVRDFIREVREAYISMGFTELEGNSVHPAFWNFDALFIPQDHPGRDMQDTFYLEGLSDNTMKRKGVVANVASTHEGGWKTGSRGWGYSWKIEEARRLVLRTHNTVLTVKALSESGEKETRVFAVSKVYRNENLDYKHLAEFYQMDGIMVGEGLNVRHLMGFLREFYKKLGMKDVKLWPTYFPYTEPSLEVVGYSDAAKAWIELSGSGVFRPEVTIPLGVRVPVLAWGPGIERLMLMRFGLDDMRELYGGDLSWLRNRVEIASR